MKKILCVLAVAAMVMVGADRASAAIVTSSSTDIFNWSSGAVTIGDKKFTYTGSTGFGSATGVNFIQVDPGTPGNYADDSFTVQLTGLSGLGDGVFTLDYTVDITVAGYVFGSAALDVDHIIDNSTATKTVTNMAMLSTVNGVPDGPHAISGGLTSISVSDSLTLSGGGTILSMSNTFTQASTAIPEPTTLALWGGIAGLGLLFSRRRKS